MCQEMYSRVMRMEGRRMEQTWNRCVMKLQVCMIGRLYNGMVLPVAFAGIGDHTQRKIVGDINRT